MDLNKTFSVGNMECCFCKYFHINKLTRDIICTNELKELPLFDNDTMGKSLRVQNLDYHIWCKLFDEGVNTNE
jgi:hypothetical protein